MTYTWQDVCHQDQCCGVCVAWDVFLLPCFEQFLVNLESIPQADFSAMAPFSVTEETQRWMELAVTHPNPSTRLGGVLAQWRLEQLKAVFQAKNHPLELVKTNMAVTKAADAQESVYRYLATRHLQCRSMKWQLCITNDHALLRSIFYQVDECEKATAAFGSPVDYSEGQAVQGTTCIGFMIYPPNGGLQYEYLHTYTDFKIWHKPVGRTLEELCKIQTHAKHKQFALYQLFLKTDLSKKEQRVIGAFSPSLRRKIAISWLRKSAEPQRMQVGTSHQWVLGHLDAFEPYCQALVNGDIKYKGNNRNMDVHYNTKHFVLYNLTNKSFGTRFGKERWEIGQLLCSRSEAFEQNTQHGYMLMELSMEAGYPPAVRWVGQQILEKQEPYTNPSPQLLETALLQLGQLAPTDETVCQWLVGYYKQTENRERYLHHLNLHPQSGAELPIPTTEQEALTRADYLGKTCHDGAILFGEVAYLTQFSQREKAAELATKAMECGHLQAHLWLGAYHLEKGTFQPELAKSILKAGMEQGSPECAYQLALQYNHYLSTVAENKLAFPAMKQAAEGGVVDAFYALAELYYLGKDVEKDDEQALFWIQKLPPDHPKAKDGNMIAYFIYLWGLTNVPQNVGFANMLRKSLEDAKHPMAMEEAQRLASGEESLSYPEVRRWYHNHKSNLEIYHFEKERHPHVAEKHLALAVAENEVGAALEQGKTQSQSEDPMAYGWHLWNKEDATVADWKAAYRIATDGSEWSRTMDQLFLEALITTAIREKNDPDTQVLGEREWYCYQTVAQSDSPHGAAAKAVLQKAGVGL